MPVPEQLGRKVFLSEYDELGRAEIQFTAKDGVIHFIWVDPKFLRLPGNSYDLLNISRSVEETAAAVLADTAPSFRTRRCLSTARSWSRATWPDLP